jgi:hypothetical protein
MSTKPSLRLALLASKKRSTPAQKREQLRESLWPGSANLIWSRKTNDGFATIPRVLSLVMYLIKQLSPKGDPSVVYLELWARAFDEGIVSITDEHACAFASGYCGNRAVRTLREHVFKLAELGFVKIKPQGNRETAHILILNPLAVCVSLRASKPTRVPEEDRLLGQA